MRTSSSRDELRQVLWPDEEFLDYTQGINVAINRLRNILRDDPRNPRFLKTIPKRGYSFYGEVNFRVIPRSNRLDTPAPDPVCLVRSDPPGLHQIPLAEPALCCRSLLPDFSAAIA